MTDKPRDLRTPRPERGPGGAAATGNDTGQGPIYIPVDEDTASDPASASTADEQVAPDQ